MAVWVDPDVAVPGVSAIATGTDTSSVTTAVATTITTVERGRTRVSTAREVAGNEMRVGAT